MSRTLFAAPVLLLAVASSIATSGTTPAGPDGTWNSYDSSSGTTTVWAGEQRLELFEVSLDADAVANIESTFITVRGTATTSGSWADIRVGLLGVYDYGNTWIAGDVGNEVEFFVDAGTLLEHCEMVGTDCVAPWDLVFTSMEGTGTVTIDWTVDVQVNGEGGIAAPLTLTEL